MNIVIRADAGLTIGIGHIMRCLSLADALRMRGASVTFICRQGAGNLIEYLQTNGYSVQGISDGISHEADRESTIEILRRFISPPDWMIVDHYELDISWEAPVRNWVKKMLIIDDLANRKHDCDILLDQNCCADDRFARYEELVPDGCVKLIGPKYALLRAQFRRIREAVYARTAAVRSLLVFMGGSDTGNVTTRVLHAIKKLNRSNIETHVVIGPANPHRKSIESLASTVENATCHFAVENIAELMASSDLSIGGGGIALWERCCLGLPTLVISVADNQVAGAQELSKQGCIIYSGWHEEVTETLLLEDIKFLLRHPGMLLTVSLRAKDIVDGQGVDRVIRHIEPGFDSMRLRRARQDDCKFVYELRNQPEVIKNSFNQSHFTWTCHFDWFTDLLASPSRVLLLAEIEAEPIGIIRYDIRGEDAEISIAVEAQYRGQDIGKSIIFMGNQWLQREKPEVKKVIASIKPENVSSKIMFLKAGFREDYANYSMNLHNDVVNLY